MTKRIPLLLLISLCCMGLTMAQAPTDDGVATNFLWYRLVSNSVGRIQVPQQVIAAQDGNLFATNTYYSKERADESSVFNFDAVNAEDKAISYGDDGEAANGNTALSIYKMTPEGKLLWYLYNSRGEIASNHHCLTGTPDGGFVTLLMVRDANSKSKTDRDLLRIVQADGSPYDIQMGSRFVGAKEEPTAEPTHRKLVPVLVKVSATGQIEYHKVFEVDHAPMPDASHYNYGTPTGCDFKGTTTDPEGNIYITGFVRTTMTIDGTEIKAKNNVGWNGDSQKEMGDFFILKFDKQGKLLKTLTEQGEPIKRSMLTAIKYQDGMLYAAGRFTGDDKGTSITIGGKSLTPSDKESLIALCIDTALNVSWISQIDVKQIPEHNWTKIFIDGIAVGSDKVYIAGRCAGGLYDAAGNELFKQPLKQHRGYALAIDRATGKPNAEWHTLLPEKGISNATAISLHGNRIILHAYALFSQTYYRVLDLNLSEASVQDYPMVSKAATSFGGDVVANSYIAGARCRNSAQLLTTTGYKEMKFDNWFSLFVAHKLPFPSVSASCKALHLSEGKATLQVLASELTEPIQIAFAGEGFSAELTELPATGGALEVKFRGAVTKTPEERIGKLTLTSGGASYEVYLYAMTETEQYIKVSQETIDFAMIPVGKEKSAELTVTQKNLMAPIKCTIEGEGAKYYKVDKSEIAVSDEQPATLQITYTPDATIKPNAKVAAQLVLTSGEVKTIVTLSGQSDTAIEEITQSQLTIATATHTLSLTSAEPMSIAVYATTGELVAQQLVSGTVEITLPAGIYFIQSGLETYRVYVPGL